MLRSDYLYRGLCGLARANRAGAMAGHLGAAVVAGHFVRSDNPDLDSAVRALIVQELDRVIRGDEALWYDQGKSGITVPELFAPFPDEEPQPEQTATLAGTLARNIGAMRQSGHNVIFASLAIRALHECPQYATPSILNGLHQLITLFDSAGPGRGYYGKQRGWDAGDDSSLQGHADFPLYDSKQTMAEIVIGDLIHGAALRRQGFGGLFHIINHAAALIELIQLGYQDVAQMGFAAHHHHVRLWRSLPDVEQELGALRRAKHDPRTVDYWRDEPSSQWSGHLTHRIKTLYGFLTLLQHIEDVDTVAQAENQFLYLVG